MTFRAPRRGTLLNYMPDGNRQFALVAPSVAPRDGQGRVMLELARCLASRGHRVTVYADRVGEELLTTDSVKWVRVEMPGGPLIAGIAAFAVRATMALRDEGGLVCVMGASAFPRVPYVYYACFSYRGWREAYRRLGRPPLRHRIHASFVDRLESICIARAEAIIAISDGVATEISTLTRGAKVSIAPGGVDTDEFPVVTEETRRQARSRLGIKGGDFVVALVGEYFTGRKGLDLLLETLALSKDPRELLLVHGSGPRARFLRRAAAASLSDRVVVSDPTLPVQLILAASDVVAVPSSYEPFSLVALEAASSGIPVVISNAAGASRPIVDGGAGIGLEGWDHVVLRGALDQLRGSPEAARAMGARGRVLASSFRWETVSEKAAEVLERAARESSLDGRLR